MALYRAHERPDDHLVADVASRLRPERGISPPPTQAGEAPAAPRPHPAPRRLTVEAALRAAWSRAAALAIVGAILAGCSPIVRSSPVAPPTIAAAPPANTSGPAPTGIGILHITTDPAFYPHGPLELRYRHDGGKLVAASDSALGETYVDLDRELPSGTFVVISNGRDCQGTVTVEANMEVDVVLSDAGNDDPCMVRVELTHPVGSIDHPEPRTAIGVLVPAESEIVVTPLDLTTTISEIREPASKTGTVEGIEVPPGRYELTVVVGGEVLTSQVVDVPRGSDWIHNLRVLPADVARDCGEFEPKDCAAAIDLAYAWGFFPEPGQTVRSVNVTTPEWHTCYEANDAAYEVIFLLAPSGETGVGIARTSRGGLDVCTY